MKKGILTIAIALVTLLSLALAGCSGTGSGGDTTSNTDNIRNAVSINFYIITGDETTEEAKTAVQKAFNDITETTFTTHVEFVFCTEAEYRQIIDTKMQTVKSLGGYYPDDNSVVTGNDTTVDDIGMVVTKYPGISDTQVDIVLIKGLSMLDEYNKENYLAPLGSYLKGDFKNLKSYIYGSVLESAYFINKNGVSVPNTTIVGSPAYTGDIYALPNNSLIGEYTYLVINKALADEFYFSDSDFSDFSTDSCAAFARLIADKYGNTPALSPLLSVAEYPTLINWGLSGDPSIAITTFRAAEVLGSKKSAVNMFSNSTYTAWMTQMLSFVEKGYVSKDPDSQEDFGIAIVKGNYDDRNLYNDDYYVKVLSYPRIENDDVFGSMLAISNFSANADRSMEIIAALTTNSELRNILQYGIEGMHYEVEKDGSLTRLNRNYIMNLADTGNALIAYPEEGINAASWYNSIEYQNRDARLSVTFGFDPWMPTITSAQTAALRSISAEYIAKIKACKTVAEFNALVEEGKAAISANSNASAAIRTINTALGTWWEEVFYVDESKA